MMAMKAAIFTGRIYDHLLPHAEKVKVAHPLMLRAIAATKKKNDKIDARKIADCLRCDFLPEDQIGPATCFGWIVGNPSLCGILGESPSTRAAEKTSQGPLDFEMGPSGLGWRPNGRRILQSFCVLMRRRDTGVICASGMRMWNSKGKTEASSRRR